LWSVAGAHQEAAARLLAQPRSLMPPRASARHAFLFACGRSLNRRAPTLTEGRNHFAIDPAHPVPTIGGGCPRRLKDGRYDQRERPDMPGSRAPYLPLRARADVLVFESEILRRRRAGGPVEVTLFASSMATDTDFTAKLLDVYPAEAPIFRGASI